MMGRKKLWLIKAYGVTWRPKSASNLLFCSLFLLLDSALQDIPKGRFSTKPVMPHTFPPNWRHRDFVSMPGLCQARVITIHLPWISSVSCLDQMPTLVHWAAVQTPWPLASRGAPVHTRPSYTITGIRPASELVLKPVSSLVSSLI